MQWVMKGLLVAALLSPMAAAADDKADTLALARRAVDLSVAEGIDAAIHRMMLPALEREPADKRAAVEADLTKQAAPTRDEILGLFADYYARSFTAQELEGIVAFYGGPLGRKLSQVEKDRPRELGEAVRGQMLKLVALFGGMPPGAR